MRRLTPSLLQRLKLVTVFSVLVFASVAFAQAVAGSPAPAKSTASTVLSYVIQAALALLLTSIIPTFVLPLLPKLPAMTQHLLDWVTHQAKGVKNAYVQGVLNRLIALAGQKVLALENTEVAYLQQQLSTGAITKDQLPGLLAGVKQRAIDAVKADATAQGLWKDALQVFFGDGTALTNWLGDVVESHVAQLPTSNLSAPKVAPATPAPSTLAALKAAPATPQKAAP